MKRSLLAACAALACAGPAAAADLVKTYSYFSINGRTMEEIEKQLSSRGPQVQSTGRRHPGATQMEFTSRVGYAEVPGGCRIVNPKVTVKAKMILPRLTQRARTDKDTRLIWDTLSADIKRHEESHVSIAKNHARELEQALAAMGKRKTCQVAQADAKAISEKILAKHDRAQVEFDRIEGINFENRIIRLLEYRIERIESGKLPG